jgi:hypothetical protein
MNAQERKVSNLINHEHGNPRLCSNTYHLVQDAAERLHVTSFQAVSEPPPAK